MAVPITPDEWIAALRAEGVTDIVEMKGWRTHNRNGRGAWGDVHASMVHHTAGEGPGLAAWCYNGNADLPGPLCHDFLARSGTLYLVGNGRANHAGRVARNAYEAVLNERSQHPAPGPDEIDGNAISYGLEVENSGEPGRDWTAKQYDVAVRVQAARCRHHGWSADSIWAHKEATRRKPADPRIDMNAFRADVAERLRHPASWTPGDKPTTPTPPAPQPKPPAPAPKPTTPRETPMALSDTVIDRIVWRLLTYRNKAADAASMKATKRRIPDVYGYIAGTYTAVQSIAADLKKVLALLTAQKEK
ncbi:N-acetylmuramoyl-L-alanine amidase [Streptomyces sp. NPDC058757]|uniref:peptidoglycan recognition protein family protein n=1 Tax=Streptomyces sp. NPDC058757 TaxID=3346626 RepID=UPI00368F8FA0